MIFTDFSSQDFGIGSSVRFSDPSTNRIQLAYENGSIESISMGSPAFQDFDFDLINISASQGDSLNDWLISKIGTQINIKDSENIFGFGTEIQEVNLISASRKTMDNMTECETLGDFSLVLRKIISTTQNVDYLIELELKVFSAEFLIANESALIALTPSLGDWAFAESERTLWEWNGSTWLSVIPLKTNDFTIIVDNINSLPLTPNKGDTAYNSTDRTYWVASQDKVWVNTPYPQMDAWRVVVPNNPNLGLKNGKMFWSSYLDRNLSEGFFKSGLIAKNGIDFPNKTAPFNQGYGIESLNGFSVNLLNTERFQIESIEFNLVGAIGSASVFKDGQIYKQRTGVVSSVSFDGLGYKVMFEPYLWLDLEQTIPSDTNILNSNSDSIISTFGDWDYAKFTLVKNLNEYYKQNGVFLFNIDSISPDLVNSITTIGFYAPKGWIPVETLDFYFTISKSGKCYKMSTPPLSFGFNNKGVNYYTLSFEDYDSAFASLILGQTFSFYRVLIQYKGDLTNDLKVKEPLKIYNFDSKTNQYTEILGTIFSLDSSGVLTISPEPKNLTVKETGKIEINSYLSLSQKVASDSFNDNIKTTYPNARVLYNGYTTQNETSKLTYKSNPFISNNFILTPSVGSPTIKGEVFGSDISNTNLGTEMEWQRAFNIFKTDKFFTQSYIYASDNANIVLFYGTSHIDGGYLPNIYNPYGFSIGRLCSVDSDFSVQQSSGTPLSAVITNRPLKIGSSANSFQTSTPNYTNCKNPKPVHPQAVLKYPLTQELIDSLIGRDEVKMLTAQSFFGFSVDQFYKNVLSADYYYHGCEYFAGTWANADLKVILKHKTDTSLDRILIQKDFQGLANRFTDYDFLVSKFTNSQSGIQNDLRASTLAKDKGTIHVLNNLPLNLGGGEYTKDEDSKTDFAVLPIDQYWIQHWIENNGYTIRVGDKLRCENFSPSSITFFIIVDIDFDTGFSQNYVNLHIKPLSGNVDDFEMIKISSLVSVLNRSDNSIMYFQQQLSIATQINYYGGQDLLKWDSSVVTEVLDPTTKLIENYDRIEFLWTAYIPDSVQNTSRTSKSVIVGCSVDDMFQIKGHKTDGKLYFDFSTELDTSKEIYLALEGRTDSNNAQINNPRTIAQNLVQQVSARNTIGFYPECFDRESYPAHYQLNGSTNVKDVLDEMTKHTFSVLTFDKNDKMMLRSGILSDRLGDSIADFDSSNIIKNSVSQVTTRNIKDIKNSFLLKFNYDMAQKKLIESLGVQYSNGQIDVSGIVNKIGDSADLVLFKKTAIDSLKVSVKDSFELASSYYNVGAKKVLEVELPWFYDSNTQALGTYPINAPLALAEKIAEFWQFVAWEFSFSVKYDWILNRAESGNRPLVLGDLVSFSHAAISGAYQVWGIVSGIDPDFYNGKVKITLYTPMDPFVYRQVYDPIWDNGLFPPLNSGVNRSENDYLLKGFQYYPFRDSYIGTNPDGSLIDGSWNATDHTFSDGSWADWDENYKPM